MQALLAVNNLRTYFHTPRGLVKAVDDLSFALALGERFGLIGESGCGKSTVALSLMRLIRAPGRIEAGQIVLDGVNILELDDEAMRRVRLAQLALISQGAMNSLNPVLRVRQMFVDGLRSHESNLSKAELTERKAELLARVDLS